MSQSLVKTSGPFVLVGGENGVTLIPSSTPLTRLNYFDGKFLRAADLEAEQRYLISLVELSNKAGGHGVAYGFQVTGSGDQLRVSPGLALDADGRVLLLPAQATLSLPELIEKSARVIQAVKRAVPAADLFGDCVAASETPPPAVVTPEDLYLLTAARAEALCGEEDVFGKLCEEACVTSTARPYRVEGVVFRVRPLLLRVPLPEAKSFPLDRTHLRSRAASAYYATERLLVASLISKDGLQSPAWCAGAPGDSGSEVPLAVVARTGSTLFFVDGWIARRERCDTPARRFWQWRMAMRPWDAFLAQILQFQCQLRDAFRAPLPVDRDPCQEARTLVGEASDAMAEFARFYAGVSDKLARLDPTAAFPGGLSALKAVESKFLKAKDAFALVPLDRLLLRRGIIELPSAGYLPVIPSGLPVNEQVRRLTGEGVDLRFCIVRPDFVAHALEEAQHLERISLLEGLDDPDRKPQVDILVPDGEIIRREPRSPGRGWDALIQFAPQRTEASLSVFAASPRAGVHFQGAARSEVLATGGAAAYAAAALRTEKLVKLLDLVKVLPRLADPAQVTTVVKLAEEGDEPPALSLKASPELLAGLNTLGAQALKFSATRRALVQPFVEAPAPAPAQVFAPTLTTPERHAALWLGAVCSRNPFQLDAAESTPVKFRFTVAAPSDQLTLTDVELSGEFVVDQPMRVVGDQRIVAGVLEARLDLESTVDGQVRPPLRLRLRLQATLTLKSSGDALQLRLQNQEGTLRFVADAAWAGDPLAARVRVSYSLLVPGALPTGAGLFDSRFTASPAVLEVGNASHTAALSALEILGAALADPKFADAQARLLFPPPPKPVDELLVRATRDWVLFHRRRNKVCAEARQVVVAAPRRYQVYHLKVASAKNVVEIRKALLAGDDALLTRAGFQPVDLVEFAPSAAALTTPLADLLADWRRVQPGNTLLYGAMASQGAAAGDGVELAKARLGRLESAVAPVSPPSPELFSEVLSAVPAPLAAPGADGVITLLTLDVVKTTCHRVFRTESELPNLAKDISVTGVAAAVEAKKMEELGTVEFVAGTSDVSGAGLDQVKAKFAALGAGQLVEAGVIFRREDVSIPADRRLEQGKKIVASLNLDPQAFPIPREIDGPCSTLTVVRTPPTSVPPVQPTRTMRLLAWRGDPASRTLVPNQPSISLPIKADGAGLVPLTTAQVAALTPLGSFVQVELGPTEASPNAAEANARLKAVVEELRARGRLSPTVTTKVISLTQADRNILPADAAAANDIVFLRIG